MLQIKHYQVLATILGIVFFTRTMTWADIAPDPLSGGKNLSAMGKEKTSVAMVDEVVRLHLSKDVCQVDVVFTMTNTGKAPETMEVGFPGNYPDELKKFKATVDGKVVNVSNKTERVKEVLDFPRERKVFWQTWQMTFHPGKPVKIGVSYFTELRDNRWRRIHELRVADHLAGFVTPTDQGAQEKRFASRKVQYYLTTGSHWLGSIGRCRIEVTFEGLTADNIDPSQPFFERGRATITSDKIVWDFTDFEPKEDVEFSITPWTTGTATLTLLETAHKQHPEAVEVTIILSEFLTAANRQLEADALLKDLLTHWQDKIAIWGPESQDRQTREKSHTIFYMIGGRTNEKLKSVEFLHPDEFVPVIQHIALRVQEQTKLAAPEYASSVKGNLEDTFQMLVWCRKHAKAER